MSVKNKFKYNFVRHTQLQEMELLVEDYLLIAQKDDIFLKLLLFEDSNSQKLTGELLTIVGDTEKALKESFFDDASLVFDKRFVRSDYTIYSDVELDCPMINRLAEFKSAETKISVQNSYLLLSQKGSFSYFSKNPLSFLFLAGRISFECFIKNIRGINLPNGLYVQDPLYPFLDNGYMYA